MARPRKTEDGADVAPAPDYVLESAFGWIDERGRHQWLPAGTSFSLPDDAARISELHRLGAAIRPA